MATSPKSVLLCLPTEVRLHIFSLALSFIDIHTVPGPPMVSPKRITGLRAEFGWYRIEDDEWHNRKPPTPMHYLKISIPLLLVSKQVRDEVSSLDWESRVRFVFSSTVSLLDVLMEWPQERVERIRRIKLLGTPLPLHKLQDPHGYITHFADSGLALLKGLQLDLLEYEDAYLPYDGSWGRDTVCHEMVNLMTTDGWKELQYQARQPYLLGQELEQLVNLARGIRQDREEPDYDFDLPSTPVIRDSDGRIEQLKDKEEWEARYDKAWDADEWQEKGAEAVLVMTATRGKAARYAQLEHGSAVTDTMKGLFARMTWRQLRESGDYLVDDGTEDPSAHL